MTVSSVRVLLVVLGALLTSSAAAQAPAPAAPPSVTVAKPVVKEVQDIDDFIGRFDAVDRVEVRARVQGYLEKVHFKDGALVKEGDRLFTIDPRPYQLAVEQAQAALANAQGRAAFATGDLERAERLRQTDAISEQVREQRRQAATAGQADVNAAQAALADAKLNLSFTDIRSPISGRISRRLVTEGNLVAANTSVLTTIVSVDPIYFYFDIDERSFLAYSGMMKGGIRSALTGGSSNEASILLTDMTLPPRKAELDFVDNRLDEASGTMRLRARVPNGDGFLAPGLFGRISLTGSPPYKAALIPDEAIATDQDRRLVFIVGPDDVVRTQVVRPGPRNDGYRIIRSGLKGDERIIVSGIQRAKAGAKVTPKEITLPPKREGDLTLSASGDPAPPAPAGGGPGGNAGRRASAQ